jgi:hypothetical protein
MYGSVRVNVEELGNCSAFVGAVLATLSDARFAENPATVTLGAPAAGARESSDPVFGVLGGVTSLKVRKEQAQLRNLLAGNRERRPAPCAAWCTRWGFWWRRG